MGLANRLVESGEALKGALELAHVLAAFPQTCLRSDRLSCYEQWGLSTEEAVRNEFRRGLSVLESGETAAGALRFAEGAGRHGSGERSRRT
jgi:enoyl-CoA hydratase